MNGNTLAALLPSMPIFLATARHLSFTRAAEELCVTQGAVSHRIRQLEKTLGFPLFHRFTRKIALTAEGESLRDALERPLLDLESGIRKIRREELTGPLLVHTPPSLATIWLVPRLTRFQALYPGIELHLRNRNTVSDFDSPTVDLAIFYGPSGMPSLHAEFLMNEWLLPVCSPAYAEEHNLRGKGPEALAGCRFLHDSSPWPNAQHHSEWLTWAAYAGIDSLPLQNGHTFDRSDLAAKAAENGLGVALGRKRLVREALDSGRLLAPIGVEAPAPQGYFAVTLREDANRPRVRAFLSWLRAEAEEAMRS